MKLKTWLKNLKANYLNRDLYESLIFVLIGFGFGTIFSSGFIDLRAHLAFAIILGTLPLLVGVIVVATILYDSFNNQKLEQEDKSEEII